ncbi:MAG TPA: hypothetical protein VKB46_08730 [Pyrinomonadaceae bacterium]|nr:hypothetical protein [Pyrinomonadaceae bacterium]
MTTMPTLSSRMTAVILILVTAAMFAAAWFLPHMGSQGISPGWVYVMVMGLMILFMAVTGIRISGRPAGILINERNIMSLARFQIVLWTIIILSAFLTAAVLRIYSGISNALAIGLDEKLWALLGISTASLIGSPLLQSPKKVQVPKEEEVNKAKGALNETSIETQGLLYRNPTIADAAFSDMFEGDEVSNTAYIDVAKTQMFFFTVVAALSYSIDLTKWISGTSVTATDAAFPLVSSGLVAILGISHAGFLTGASTTHTPTDDKKLPAPAPVVPAPVAPAPVAPAPVAPAPVVPAPAAG